MNSISVKSSKTKTKTKTKTLTSSTPAQITAKSMRGRTLKGKLEQPTFEVPASLSDSYEILPTVESKPITKAIKPTILKLVCEAIEKLGVPKKGASYVSIRKWIIDNHATSRNITSAYLRKAIERGLETEVLIRPGRYKDLQGLKGFFALAKSQPPKKEKTKVATVVKESKSSPQKTGKTKTGSVKSKKAGAVKAAIAGSVSDTEVTIQGTKKVPKRLNVSDTTIMEAKTTRLKSAESNKVAKSKVNAKIITKKTILDKAASISKPKERLTGIKKPKLVPSKVSKAKSVAKTVNSEVQAKETKIKKLYSSNIAPGPKNFSRKDLSDTELEVKPVGRKSMKSYSSDTDINLIGSKKDPNHIKPKRKAMKKTNLKAL